MSSNSGIYTQPRYPEPLSGLARRVVFKAVNGAEASAGGPGKLLSREETVSRSVRENLVDTCASGQHTAMISRLVFALVADTAWEWIIFIVADRTSRVIHAQS